MKISKPVILVKLGLSEKFLRTMLYTRKIALGIGIIKILKIIAILTIKLYLGHKRLDNRIAKIIKINEENAKIQYECKDYPIET